MIRKRAISLFLSLFVLLVTCTASASLSPAQAEQDQAATSESHQDFCHRPHQNLDRSSLHLCPLAHDLPDCQGFQDACDLALHPKVDPFWAWLKKPLDAIARALGSLFKLLGPVGIWVIAGGVLMLILFPIVQALAQSRRDALLADPVAFPPMPMTTKPELAKLSREDDATRVLAEADALASQGLLDRALYRYLHAALISLDKKGAIRIARETTHGEYIRACSDADARPALRELVREIERVRFGGQEASLGGVSVAQERATRIVRRAMGALVMLAGLLLIGCSMQASPSAASGHETLQALLEKQNVTVKRSTSPLAKLPLPTDRDRRETPAVFVDVEQVSLQPEAQEHLLRWVEAGGILVLAGSPTHWPSAFAAKDAPSTTRDIEVTTLPDDDAENEEPRIDHGKLARPAALSWVDERTFVLASTANQEDYAAGQIRGAGAVYGIASDDLFTNAGLAIPGNAGAAIAILANVPKDTFIFAGEGDGFSPPSNPFAGLVSAGLGLPLVHALFATIILFFAVGIRLSAPTTEEPVRRRAFAEHVRATAAVYARSGAAKHALASFSRYAETRMSKKLNRSASDVVTFLAQRSGERIEECAHLWGRALAARDAENDPPNGDELKILQRLSAIYSRAMQ